MFYLTTHSTHFIYGYMASDIWLRTILIVRKETRCRHIGYSYRLAARVLLYAPSHRQDNTYHSLCYTSRGALAGTRNSSMGPPHEGSIRRPTAPWANALPLSYVPLPSGSRRRVCKCTCVWYRVLRLALGARLVEEWRRQRRASCRHQLPADRRLPVAGIGRGVALERVVVIAVHRHSHWRHLVRRRRQSEEDRNGNKWMEGRKEGNVSFNNTLNTFYLRLYGRKEGNVSFNNTLNTFYVRLYGVKTYGKGPFRKRERKPAAATWATLSD